MDIEQSGIHMEEDLIITSVVRSYGKSRNRRDYRIATSITVRLIRLKANNKTGRFKTIKTLSRRTRDFRFPSSTQLSLILEDTAKKFAARVFFYSNYYWDIKHNDPITEILGKERICNRP